MALILVVDDEEMERVFQRAVLESAGHQLVFASDGEAALKHVQELSLDAVVTDLAMPNFNGLRFIRELKESGSMVPIIAVSGRAADQLDLAQDYGAAVVLTKPVNPRELLDAVDTVLDSRNSSGSADAWKRERY